MVTTPTGPEFVKNDGADSSQRRNIEAMRRLRWELGGRLDMASMLVEKREWFARVISQGMSNSEACRVVGINRRTGTRWRYGRTILNTAGEAVHYPPVKLTAPKARHPRYLSLAERTTIADLRRAGVSVRDIADELGRAASTVSRELRRNTDGRGRYLPATAQRLSTERRSRSLRARRVTRDVQLYGVVADLLGKRWSPEQDRPRIAGAVP